ncbi:MAG: bifunctional methylenetetrahydrofolate dehydrogenase/methenyltetrahydrofolate cyclohydrolase [Rickettsiales bacterium]|nr:bifunctional methylenetetrahydrofolate dehydrogenase/methenyltetrahydrofolate cyclohydrolase [Rickettsiales bacterium]
MTDNKSAKIIDGKAIANNIKNEIAQQVKEIKQKFSITPTLAVILVGSDPASEVYVGNKEKSAHFVGMNSMQFKFSDDINEIDLIKKINELNSDNNVHGILVQLPLPKHIDSKNVIKAIDSIKDVDGFNIINVGKLSVGELEGKDSAIIPCTPLGCLHLIKDAISKSSTYSSLVGLKALVIGASNIVGRPMARLLMLEGCTVTIANRSTKDLKSECLLADIVVSATGVPNLINASMIKKDAIIIDVGINRINIGENKTKIVGDVNFESAITVASSITPVPGGVGPMTIAYLLKNTLKCCLKIINKSLKIN